jgi:high affinity cAMP-specific and IBMX-insensitive 3',5'-cyclic phosphodiesterase 8
MFQELYVKFYTSSFAGVSGQRRQSIAKLHNLSIEAPITRVITLITSVQDNASVEVVQTLDKVCILLPKAPC